MRIRAPWLAIQNNYEKKICQNPVWQVPGMEAITYDAKVCLIYLQVDYTAGPRMTLFSSTSFHYKIGEKKKSQFPGRATVNVESVCSTHVCMGSFRYSFPPTSHRCACQVNWCLTSSLSLCGCERVLQWKDILPRVGFRPAPWAAGIGTGHLDPD